MLYPHPSRTRQVADLSGVWKFKVDRRHEGRRCRWFRKPLAGAVNIRVPASYNDWFADASIRDHVGDVWYERRFAVPRKWSGRRMVLRFGAVAHRARVWIDGRCAGGHSGGFLPFELDVSGLVRPGRSSRLTVAVNNVLSWKTLPPGEVRTAADGNKAQEYWFDFFHYSGIHRPVKLSALPRTHLRDLSLSTRLKKNEAWVSCAAEVRGSPFRIEFRLKDRRGKIAAAGQGPEALLKVRQPRLWTPAGPYLYRFETRLFDRDGRLIDEYAMPFGLRSVSVRGRRFLLNQKPFYFRGFGKHEDSVKLGRGLNPAMNRRDARLMKWTGANSFRTSHYPYSEEWLQLADREGFAVIGEAPAVGMNFLPAGQEVFTRNRAGGALLKNHLRTLAEMIARDRNHACVVMWSVANEPASHERRAAPYFQKVFAQARRLDPSRPVALVTCAPARKEKAAGFGDVLCVNRYYGWYEEPGRLAAVSRLLASDLRAWWRRFRKPVLLTEFGADAIAGFHSDPPVMFTEEYQRDLLARSFEALDRLPFLIGEHVWNFADFTTRQGVLRAGGNRKGVFTRQRKPKMSVYLLRKRWQVMKSRSG